MERWSGRVAVVTGASAGIGAGLAKSLVQHGLRVVGIARRDENIKALANELAASGAPGKLYARQADLTEEADILEAVRWIKQTLGGIDVMVNIAGILLYTSLAGDDEGKYSNPQSKWRTMLDLNIMATAIFNREAIKDMKARGVVEGHILNIGSTTGQNIVGFPGAYMYAGTKHAVRVMNEGLRRELRGTKIRVTSVSPGLVRTEWWKTSGLDQTYSDDLYDSSVCLNVDDVVQAFIFALGCPPHVQVHELTIKPVGEKF